MADRELGWNESIEKDGEDFTVLTEGDYPFQVTQMEKSRFGGSVKLPPCNMAILHIDIIDPDNDGRTVCTIKHRLYLHTKTEGLVCAFFRSIGHRKHGERITPDWNKVIGATGLCHVKPSKSASKKNPDNTLEFNNIEKFLDPGEGTPAPAAETGQSDF